MLNREFWFLKFVQGLVNDERVVALKNTAREFMQLSALQRFEELEQIYKARYKRKCRISHFLLRKMFRKSMSESMSEKNFPKTVVESWSMSLAMYLEKTENPRFQLQK